MATSATELATELFLHEFLPSPDSPPSPGESSQEPFIGLRDADALSEDALSEQFVTQFCFILVAFD